jgi:hypothetical protein
MNTPAGLHCVQCHLPFSGDVVRRTLHGLIHARPCASPEALVEGRWKQTKAGVRIWQPYMNPAKAHAAYGRGIRTEEVIEGERAYQRNRARTRKAA